MNSGTRADARKDRERLILKIVYLKCGRESPDLSEVVECWKCGAELVRD